MTQQIARALSKPLSAVFQAELPPERVRLPAFRAHASLHIPRGCSAEHLTADDFPPLYDAPLVDSLAIENDWLLFYFSDAFFDALVSHIRMTLPPAADDLGEHAINRMRALSRHDGDGCPREDAFQYALLRGLCAKNSPAAFSRACRDAEALFWSIPPRKRPSLSAQCGAYGDAMARLIHQAKTEVSL